MVGLNIKLERLPSNSPDPNIFDLGFSNAMQSLQNETSSKNIEELVSEAESAFAMFDPLENSTYFLSRQSAIECTPRDLGSN